MVINKVNEFSSGTHALISIKMTTENLKNSPKFIYTAQKN